MPSTQRRTAAQVKNPEPPKTRSSDENPKIEKREIGNQDSDNHGHSGKRFEARCYKGARKTQEIYGPERRGHDCKNGD